MHDVILRDRNLNRCDKNILSVHWQRKSPAFD